MDEQLKRKNGANYLCLARKDEWNMNTVCTFSAFRVPLMGNFGCGRKKKLCFKVIVHEYNNLQYFLNHFFEDTLTPFLSQKPLQVCQHF